MHSSATWFSWSQTDWLAGTELTDCDILLFDSISVARMQFLFSDCLPAPSLQHAIASEARSYRNSNCDPGHIRRWYAHLSTTRKNIASMGERVACVDSSSFSDALYSITKHSCSLLATGQRSEVLAVVLVVIWFRAQTDWMTEVDRDNTAQTTETAAAAVDVLGGGNPWKPEGYKLSCWFEWWFKWTQCINKNNSTWISRLQAWLRPLVQCKEGETVDGLAGVGGSGRLVFWWWICCCTATESLPSLLFIALLPIVLYYRFICFLCSFLPLWCRWWVHRQIMKSCGAKQKE